MHNRRAMGVFARALPWMSLALTTSCVVPIPATPEESDAGARQDTPTITKSSPIDFPGPVPIPGTQAVTLTLRDGDLRDTLYVRVFKNYTPASASRGLSEVMVRNDPVNGKEERTAPPIMTTGWCQLTPGENVIIDIVVADEPFDDSGSGITPFKTPINNGRWSERNFVVSCSP